MMYASGMVEKFLFLIIKPYLSKTTAVCSFTKVEKSAVKR